MNTLRYFDFGAARPVLLLIARIAVVLIFIIFGFPKMMGFDGTVQYMASLDAPMPMLAAIIAVVMEVPAAILIVLGFFTRPLAVLFIFYTLGTAVIDWAQITALTAEVATIARAEIAAATIGWAQVGRLVYGAPDEKRGYRRFAPQALHPRTEVTAGVLAGECGQLVKDFFRDKRR